MIYIFPLNRWQRQPGSIAYREDGRKDTYVDVCSGRAARVSVQLEASRSCRGLVMPRFRRYTLWIKLDFEFISFVLLCVQLS